MQRTTHGSALVGALSLAFLIAAGCGNTADGVRKDAQINARAADEASHEAGKDMAAAAHDANKTLHGAGKNVAGALEITPSVKVAIAADEQLNDKRNKIDVDTADGVVHLKGHVVSAALKAKAGAIAQKALADIKATDKVENHLEVAP